MDLYQFLELSLRPGPHQRRGQRLINNLELIRPDISKKISNTERDPFYNDHLLWSAIKFIVENW